MEALGLCIFLCCLLIAHYEIEFSAVGRALKLGFGVTHVARLTRLFATTRCRISRMFSFTPTEMQATSGRVASRRVV